jgi:hypothetical protein
MTRRPAPSKQVRPFRTRRRKLSVELYFVLYLSAIILLLGTTPIIRKGGDEDLEEAIVALSTPDFDVRARRAALLYSFIPTGARLDTNGLKLRRDTVNQIHAYGSFSSVRFDIVSIEDSVSGTRLPMEYAMLVQNGRSADFLWNPHKVDRDAVYIVTVRATAEPLPRGTNMRPEIREKVAEVLRRRGPISDSVTFTVNLRAVTTQEMLVAQLRAQNIDSGLGGEPMIDTTGFAYDPFNTASALTGPITTQPSTPVVYALPKNSWSNRVFITGTAANDPDLRFEVKPPSASITTQGQGFIDISGIAPQQTGTQRVTVTTTRISDGQTVSTWFDVKTESIPSPNLPDFLLVGQPRRLDFSIDNVPNQQVAVEVYENDRLVIGQDQRKVTFTYTPSNVGRVRFVRYLNDREVDRAELNAILPPPPKIGEPQRIGPNVVQITTYAYGMIDGTPNRAELKVQEGNVGEPKQMSYNYDQNQQASVQVWQLERKRTADPFTFSIYALDRRGSNGGKSLVVPMSFR